MRLPGASGAAALDMAVDGFAKRGLATPHDRVVAGAIARVLTGGDTDLVDEIDEDALFDLEHGEIMALIRHPDTLARVEHMLETGKPLRN